MNCYDCHNEGTTTPAVATCVDCGAGACTRHLHDDPEPLRSGGGTGRTWSQRDSRRLVCLVCHRTAMGESKG
ncbi:MULTISPECIES: DUF2180 family protein [unclassified Streptomyces]|uniref:DUF2180 family protein n=1 Tax=unclassified Streptomyces TaxID=2593676 RepID=UPI002DDAC743|nr:MULTISPECIES: DUF2180 family protein [unclassified Streptomyces]WSA90947.1 DUF2180 family protein [Streptomyces sp. NBC_01795]WSB75272.1 DUF2180 family protein [Streptomyces sp. NBC_01775]WSS16445.1 DUF2180 family protein [Streptomyces sp. NBC_01186]WSS45263.1 DUF2180 family protein [Streptomyces sp. NBC_01187]